MKFDLTKLDIQMMKDLDALPQSDSGLKGVVWMRDDWLCLRGMAFCVDREQYDFAELVAQFKEVMRAEEGYEFNCDKWYEGEK
jgi:hypothetical protein